MRHIMAWPLSRNEAPAASAIDQIRALEPLYAPEARGVRRHALDALSFGLTNDYSAARTFLKPPDTHPQNTEESVLNASKMINAYGRLSDQPGTIRYYNHLSHQR